MPGFWVRDALHMPRPVTPLAATTIVPAAQKGIAHALVSHGIRGDILNLRIEHGYLYYGYLEPFAFPRPKQEELSALKQQFLQLPTRWEHEVLPEVRRMHEELRALAPPGADHARLARDAQRVQAVLEDTWTVHFDLFRPLGFGMMSLQSIVGQAGAEQAAARTHALISGEPNEISRLDSELLELGAELEHDAGLAGLLPRPHALVEALLRDDSTLGARFRGLWPRLRDRPHQLDLGAPTWGEDPSPLARALAGGRAARQKAAAAGEAVQRRRAREEKDVREGLPESTRPVFDEFLQGARTAAHLHQTHHYWMDELTVGLARLALLRCAEPLVGRGLSQPADVQWLRLDELVRLLEMGEVAPQDLLRERRRARDVALRTQPPATLGDADSSQPAAALIMSIVGASGPAAAQAGGLCGLPASPGRCRAPARVILDPSDLDSLQPGEVLVTVATDPSWTLLLGRSGALVTEAGGMLSHAAVVARERGVPAVVGVREATTRIKTGDVVDVDGEKGTVRLSS